MCFFLFANQRGFTDMMTVYRDSIRRVSPPPVRQSNWSALANKLIRAKTTHTLAQYIIIL